MIIKYHIQLLKLSLLSDYFNGFESFSLVNYKLLLNGLYYPDLPCNTLKVNSNNEIKYLNYNACYIPTTLIYLLYEENYGLKQTVQSHRGRQAIGHSTTYDDTETMITIRQKILRRLEILYMLALNDNSTCYAENSNLTLFSCSESPPNIFWIGQILHCVQDSYSIVHTLRQSKFQTQHQQQPKPQLKDNVDSSSISSRLLKPSRKLSMSKNIRSSMIIKDRLSKKEHYNYSFRLIRYINIYIINTTKFEKEFKENITADNINLYIKKEISKATDITDADKIEFLKIIENNPKDLFSIFKLMYFFYHQKKRLLSLFENDNNSLPSHKNIDKNDNPDPNYPYIISFYYIPDQKDCEPLFHIKNDIRTVNKNNEPYNIENCRFILNLYKEHVFDTRKTLQEKIAKFIEYVSINVFPIPAEYHNNGSSDIIKDDICLKKKINF